MAGRRIMLFSHMCYPSHITGGEKLLLFFTRELSRTDLCQLVVPNEGILAERARGSGIEVIVQPYPLSPMMWEPGPRLDEELAHVLQPTHVNPVINLLHMHRPDLVVAATCINPLPAAAAKRIGIPVLWMITEAMCETPQTSHAVQIIDHYSDWILGISQTSLQPFHRAGLSHKVYLNYPSWLPEEMEPEAWAYERYVKRNAYGLSDGQKLVGYISSDIAPHKGLEHFVAMAVGVCQSLPHVHFLIVGNPTDRDYYNTCVRNIHLSGYASRFIIEPFGSRVQSIYPAMDVLVVPSMVREGFGMTALEGMIFGMPVVAYRSGGLEEMLTIIGKGSLLAEQGDITGLANIVHTLTAHEELCRTTGGSCQSAVQEMFGIGAYRSRLDRMQQALEPGFAHYAQLYAAVRSQYGEGRLLKGASTPAVFLIQNRTKRPFASQEAMARLGLGWHQVTEVDDSELQGFPTGVPIH